jgi:hypothetical protein
VPSASLQVVHYIWHDSVYRIPVERVHIDPHSATKQKGCLWYNTQS